MEVKLFFFLFFSIFSLFFIKLIINYSLKYKLVDFPSKRKIHKIATPFTGGFFIFFSVLFFLYSYYFIFEISINKRLLLCYVFGSFSYLFLGFFDDIYELDGFKKMIIVIIINLIILSLLPDYILIKNINILDFNFILSRYENILIGVLFFSFFIFSYIIVDGINCLAILIFLLFLVINIISNNQLINDFYFVLIIPTIIFIIFNYNSKIFLGNNGAFLISFNIIFIILIHYGNTFLASSTKLDFNFWLCFFLIIFYEIIRVTIERLLNRISFLSGDNRHLHYLIYFKCNLNLKKTLVIYFLLFLTPTILNFFINKLSIVMTVYLILYLGTVNFLKTSVNHK